MHGKIGIQVPQLLRPGEELPLGFLISLLQEHVALFQGEGGCLSLQRLLVRARTVQGERHPRDADRLSRNHADPQAIGACTCLFDRGGDPGAVIAVGLHRRQDLIVRLPCETFEPQPVHLSFLNQSRGEYKRVPYIFQDIALKAFHDDLDRFGGGQRSDETCQE